VSGAIRMAKAQFRGDPGLFSFVGKAIKSVGKLIPGVSTAINIAEGVGSLLAGNGKPKNPSIAKAAPTLPAVNVSSAGMFAGPAPALPSMPQQGNQYGLVNIQRPGLPMGPGNNTQSQPGGGSWQTSTGAPCQSGYHRNKHGYYSQRYGWVAAGSVCVKNRKRNPLNPRAASRAMARLHSAKKATRAIQKFFGQTHRPGAAVVKKGPCGCKGRR
jgi:hypothetical protein